MFYVENTIEYTISGETFKGEKKPSFNLRGLRRVLTGDVA
jgi:hypothetical protein